jgi:hypothetical protein
MSRNRRDFIKISVGAGAGWILPHGEGADRASGEWVDARSDGWPAGASGEWPGADDELSRVSYDLLKDWGEGLLRYRMGDKSLKGLYGGILCPACGVIHGRTGDALYPFLLLADRTKDPRYLEAAAGVYEWMEANVSCADGSWTNEINVSSWKGTTVFAATALAESLIHFRHLLDGTVKDRYTRRLRKAMDYIYDTFDIHTGNINYPIAGSYALTLTGRLLGEERYVRRGAALAEEALQSVTPNDRLIYGEGHPQVVVSPKGCWSVDLGYNVEESLPSLVMLAKLRGDARFTATVVELLRAHMEFMLPDGAWDNSWGTRNFKWTYWGSRTSDGCQPAYALMAEHDPAFYQVALRNVQLMRQCTQGQLLYGGPHVAGRGILPCVHLTFSHAKALAGLLLQTRVVEKEGAVEKASPIEKERAVVKPPPVVTGQAALLPREKAYGMKHFKDIRTWLVAVGDWRGTVTGNDMEYSMKGGHATGGALSMLWHPRTGPIIAASMNKYQLVEAFNMQSDKDGTTMCLTPRWELRDGASLYMNINDLQAAIDHREESGEHVFTCVGDLVDEEQVKKPGGCRVIYRFGRDAVTLQATCTVRGARFILPVIAPAVDKIRIDADKPGMKIGRRVFNFVPGMEAIPYTWEAGAITIKISLI